LKKMKKKLAEALKMGELETREEAIKHCQFLRRNG
jgi:hypothetical protein